MIKQANSKAPQAPNKTSPVKEEKKTTVKSPPNSKTTLPPKQKTPVKEEKKEMAKSLPNSKPSLVSKAKKEEKKEEVVQPFPADTECKLVPINKRETGEISVLRDSPKANKKSSTKKVAVVYYAPVAYEHFTLSVASEVTNKFQTFAKQLIVTAYGTESMCYIPIAMAEKMGLERTTPVCGRKSQPMIPNAAVIYPKMFAGIYKGKITLRIKDVEDRSNPLVLPDITLERWYAHTGDPNTIFIGNKLIPKGYLEFSEGEDIQNLKFPIVKREVPETAEEEPLNMTMDEANEITKKLSKIIDRHGND